MTAGTIESTAPETDTLLFAWVLYLNCQHIMWAPWGPAPAVPPATMSCCGSEQRVLAYSIPAPGQTPCLLPAGQSHRLRGVSGQPD